MSDNNFPVVLSFDVGVINLSYCLLTQKQYIKTDGTTYIDWQILDWDNIDLTNRDAKKCSCGLKASLTQTTNNEIKYYCKIHGKKVNNLNVITPFEKQFMICDKTKKQTCIYEIRGGKNCDKSGSYINNELCYCTTHAKQKYKSDAKQIELKPFKLKSSTTLNFDDVKYGLIMELEKKTNLLTADHVVIENQPSFKNPRMKSIASTIYDYYLIRGIIDKKISNSKITQVKFMSPSNKLKLASEGDTKQLIKAKKTDDTTAYKLTKSLGIKYCLDLINHLPDWIKHFNSFKKRDDLADSFLQGAYFYSNVLQIVKPIKPSIENVVSKVNIQLIKTKPIKKSKKQIDKNIEI